jgi:peptidoglycan hydrolase CwlO-like protein
MNKSNEKLAAMTKEIQQLKGKLQTLNSLQKSQPSAFPLAFFLHSLTLVGCSEAEMTREVLSHELVLMKERLAQTSFSQLEAEIKTLTDQLAEIKKQAEKAKEDKAELTKKCSELEQSITEFESSRNNKQKQMETEVCLCVCVSVHPICFVSWLFFSFASLQSVKTK